jgi:L-ascorbate metabolism protein UlaG (beta-lactamase superfamily)
MKMGLVALSALLVIACGSSGDTSMPAPSNDAPTTGSSPTSETSPPSTTPAPASSATGESAPPAPPGLKVKFLGVAGFMLEYGGDAVLSAPLFTRPSMFEVTAGFVDSDPLGVDKHLPASSLTNLRAVISGHAHYDHLLDVPTVLDRAKTATLYGNRSAKNLLAAFAPDRAAKCTGAKKAPYDIARSRVVALDDTGSSVVDYRACPALKPEGAPLEGKWVSVPGSHVRLLAMCSTHPDQVGPYHYAEGHVDEEQCNPPQRMDAWKEGNTLSFLVDFLDPATNEPVFRAYYQDAPTDLPTGLPPDVVLAGKRVDVALLCVGSSDSTEEAPAPTVTALTPRYVIGGHWEDFFQPAEETPSPIAFLDVPAWSKRARAALSLITPEPKELVRNGKGTTTRALIADPMDAFEIPR